MTLGSNNFRPQRTSDVNLTLSNPLLVLRIAQWPERLVKMRAVINVETELGSLSGHQRINLPAQLVTEGIKWKVVNVAAERIFQFVTNRRNTEAKVATVSLFYK